MAFSAAPLDEELLASALEDSAQLEPLPLSHDASVNGTAMASMMRAAGCSDAGDAATISRAKIGLSPASSTGTRARTPFLRPSRTRAFCRMVNTGEFQIRHRYIRLADHPCVCCVRCKLNHQHPRLVSWRLLQRVQSQHRKGRSC